MILTVTLNAALDVTYLVEDGVHPGATHRVRSVAQRAGGKGVNTARVLTSLGEPVLALGLAGGAPGAELRADLDAAGLAHRFTAVAGASRRTVAVVDASGAVGVTGFWEPGPQVSAAEWRAFLTDFRAALPTATAVLLAGSLPPGVPRDAYAVLVSLASTAGLPTLVDADAQALRAALPARPTLVKPNAEEALRALGEASGSPAPTTAIGSAAFPVGDTPEPGRPASGAARLQALGRAPQPAEHTSQPGHPAQPASTEARPKALGSTPQPAGGGAGAGWRLGGPVSPLALAQGLVGAGAQGAVVSAGVEGMVAWWGGRGFAVAPPRVVGGNATGAGDAASAALAVALARGVAPAEALARAVALSAAAVAAPLAGDVDPAVLAELEPLVAVRDVT